MKKALHNIHKKKRWHGSRKSTTSTQSGRSTAQGNTYSQKGLSGKVKGDACLQSGRISVTEPDKSSLEARRIIVEGGRSSSRFSSQRQEKSVFTRSARDEESTATTHSMTSLTPGMKLKPTEGIEVTINATLDQLEQNPATAWIRDVRKIPSVRWHLVHDEYDEWRHKSRALTPGCMAIIALATSIATAGIGASVSSSAFLVEALGKTAAHVIGTMAQAGMTTLATNATTTLINNQGNIGRTLKDVVSSAQLRELATSIAAAGATAGLSSQLGVSQGKAFADLLQRSAVQTGVSTALRMATQGLNLREGVLQGIANIVADTVGGLAANEIGDLYHPLDPAKPSSIGWIEHKVLHAGLGALVGGASNLRHPLEGAKAGAFAVLAETVAELVGPSYEALKEKRLSGTLTSEDVDRYNTHMRIAGDIGRIAAALTSFVLKQDVNATDLASTNAIENNFLQIPVAIAAVLPEVIAAAKVSWELYALTHEKQLEQYKQEICKVVAEKTGYSQETISTVFDWAMPVISITQGIRNFVRKAPALLKKLPANRNVSPEVQKGAGNPQKTQGPPVKGRSSKGKATTSKSAPLDSEGRWPQKEGKGWRDQITGRAQQTGTEGHRFRSYREAIIEAKKSDTEHVYLDRGYKKATGESVTPNRRPDVTVVKKDKTVHATEVRSKTDEVDVLYQRNREAMRQLPPEREGKVHVIKPTSTKEPNQ